MTRSRCCERSEAIVVQIGKDRAVAVAKACPCHCERSEQSCYTESTVAHYVVRFARHAGLAALFITTAIVGILSGVLFAYAGDLPQVSALDDYTPSTITRVYASDGQVIGEFATQRRVIIGYDEIGPVLRQAIIATEDAEFDRHVGVNFWRILVAARTDIIERRRAQGASTLTQQLARNMRDQFGLTSEKSFERKIKEIILAVQIEKRYTKKRSSRSTATRCTSATAPTASRRRRGCTSTRGTPSSIWKKRPSSPACFSRQSARVHSST